MIICEQSNCTIYINYVTYVHITEINQNSSVLGMLIWCEFVSISGHMKSKVAISCKTKTRFMPKVHGQSDHMFVFACTTINEIHEVEHSKHSFTALFL